MRPKMYALIAGLVMIVVGVLAFVPALNMAPPAAYQVLNLDTSYSFVFGYIPMNVINKVALIVIGALGVAASMAPATALPKSILWSRVTFYLSGVLAILGLFPQTNTLFGYMPLYGWNVGLYAVFAVLGAYFGYALTSRVPDQKMAPSQSHVAGVH